MAVPRCSTEEFIEIWRNCSGSAGEVAKILNIGINKIHERRRNIEKRLNIQLRCTTGHHSSPDTYLPDIQPEFPDWQHIEIKNGLLVVFSDAHFVYGHKSTAHRALLKFVVEFPPLVIIENGDLLDFPSISRHHRIGWDKQPMVAEEIKWANRCLLEIKQAAPSRCLLRRNMGNHDQRFSGFFSNLTPKMEGVPGLRLDEQIKGWPVAWATRINDNQLEATHRWKSGIHAPHNNTMWAGISYATGHLHSQKVMPITDLRGDRWGVDVGTLASIYGPQFRYLEAKPRNWRAGFATFRFENYELRMPELMRVVDEKKGLVEWRGKDYVV